MFKGMGAPMAGVGAGPGGLVPQAVQQQGV